MLVKPFVTFVLLMSLAVPVWAQEKGWKKEWMETLAAARKEGRVVLVGSTDPTVRRELTAKFQKRFGITLEYLGVRSGEMVGRVRIERRAGAHTIDAWMSGTITAATILYPEKWLTPLKPTLVLPEVLDASKWKKGKPWFTDPRGEYVLRLNNYVSAILYLNTKYVKVKEIQSIKDLLNPKWKGKISVYNPSVQGSGSNIAAFLYMSLGEDFVKKLYVDQRPGISRNFRQVGDWLAQGKYPITIGLRERVADRVRADGIPVETIYRLRGLPERVVAGIGNIALMNRPPNPNAARVFANWITSKEGLETYSRAYGTPTLRNDVDESFLPPRIIPRPGVEYFDASGWEFGTQTQEKVRLRMKQLLRK